MRAILVVVALMVVFGQAMAQQSATPGDSLSVDSLHVEKEVLPRKYGFWLAAYLEPVYLKHADGANLALGLSFVSNEQYHIGFYGNAFRGQFSERLIFPNEFSMRYGHAGIWLGYKTDLEKPFDFTADLKVGEGKVFWERTDNFYNMFEDFALFINPTVGVDYKVLKFVALHTEIGYRAVRGLDLPEVTDADFSGLSVNFMIKVGLF